MDSAPLRSRQSALAREAIIEAAAEVFATGARDDVTVRAIAEASGVSLRTLYRYFPTRDALLEAAAARVMDQVPIPASFASPEEIPQFFLDVSGPFAERMELARALMTTPGLQARHRRHPHFISAVERTMAPLLEGQSALEQKQIAALIFVMANLSTWLAMCDEAGLSPDASRQAAAWAISVLLAEIRRGARPRDLDLREILP